MWNWIKRRAAIPNWIKRWIDTKIRIILDGGPGEVLGFWFFLAIIIAAAGTFVLFGSERSPLAQTGVIIGTISAILTVVGIVFTQYSVKIPSERAESIPDILSRLNAMIRELSTHSDITDRSKNIFWLFMGDYPAVGAISGLVHQKIKPDEFNAKYLAATNTKDIYSLLGAKEDFLSTYYHDGSTPRKRRLIEKYISGRRAHKDRTDTAHRARIDFFAIYNPREMEDHLREHVTAFGTHLSHKNGKIGVKDLQVMAARINEVLIDYLHITQIQIAEDVPMRYQAVVCGKYEKNTPATAKAYGAIVFLPLDQEARSDTANNGKAPILGWDIRKERIIVWILNEMARIGGKTSWRDLLTSSDPKTSFPKDDSNHDQESSGRDSEPE